MQGVQEPPSSNYFWKILEMTSRPQPTSSNHSRYYFRIFFCSYPIKRLPLFHQVFTTSEFTIVSLTARGTCIATITVHKDWISLLRYTGNESYKKKLFSHLLLKMHRTLSTRSKQPPARSSPSPAPPLRRKVSLFASLRASTRPDLSRRLFRLIKSENHVITAYNTAAHERQCIATQLSEWGESTGDDAVSELSDKLGVILAEIGGLEEGFATNLEGCRTVLKTIRNTESSVGPSRENRARILEDIRRLEYKEPNSPRLAILEQELVRAEAENLVAEAQLTNITRAKLKEAYVKHFAAVVERAEKQAILARHGRRMLELLNDEPVVPGDMHEPFEREGEARQILNDAEEELRQWTSDIEESSLAQQVTTTAPSSALIPQATPQVTEVHPAHREVHPALRNGSSTVESFAPSTYGSAYNEPPYPISEEERAARTMIAA